MSFTTDNMTKTAFPMLDMMLQMQQIGMRAMSLYQPITAAFLDGPFERSAWLLRLVFCGRNESRLLVRRMR